MTDPDLARLTESPSARDRGWTDAFYRLVLHCPGLATKEYREGYEEGLAAYHRKLEVHRDRELARERAVRSPSLEFRDLRVSHDKRARK